MTTIAGTYKYGLVIGGGPVTIAGSGYISDNGSESSPTALFSKYSPTLLNYGIIKGTHINSYGTPHSIGVTFVGSYSKVINNSIISGTYRGIALPYGGTVTNFGEIYGGSGGEAGGVVIGGVTLTGGGSIANYGIIIGGAQIKSNGVTEGGSLTNGSASDTHALIKGTYAVEAGAVANFGTIIGASYVGTTFVNGSAADTLAVSGDVEIGVIHLKGPEIAANYGTVGGVYLLYGGRVTNGTASDTAATIEGGGVATSGAASYTTVTNFGTSGGVVLGHGGGRITNGSDKDTSALITGAGGIFIDGTGMVTGYNFVATVTNYGTISSSDQRHEGVGIYARGLFTNGSMSDRTALITAPGYARGIALYGGVTLANFGTISGGPAGAVGAYLSDGCTLTNGAAGDASALVEGGLGVRLHGGSTAINYGVITSLDGYAVTLKSSTDVLELEAGSQVVGEIDAGAGRIEIVSGSPAITGGVITAGTIGGAGTLALSGGLSTFGAGASLTVADVSVSGSATMVDVTASSLTFAGVWNQSGGTLAAAAGHAMTFTGTGDSFAGTLSGRGLIDFTSGSDTLSGLTVMATDVVIEGATVTVSGPVDIATGSVLKVAGAIANSGVVSVTSSGAATYLGIGDNTTLSGGGAVSLAGSNAKEDVIYGLDSNASLTNVDNTIAGAGDLGEGRLTVINQAAGVIDANGPASLALWARGTVANAGLIEATGSGGLSILSAVNNAGGGVIAAAGGKVYLEGADILGGTLRSSAGKFIYVASGVDTLDGTASPVTNQGEVVIENGQTLNLAGSIANTGLIVEVSDGAATTLNITAGGAVLSGGGQVFMVNAAEKIIGSTSSSTTDPGCSSTTRQRA